MDRRKFLSVSAAAGITAIAGGLLGGGSALANNGNGYGPLDNPGNSGEIHGAGSSLPADWKIVAPTGADDQIGIQAAIDSLGPTGGVVYLSAGDYVITDTILVNKNHVRLIGAGKEASVLRMTVEKKHGILVKHANAASPIESVYIGHLQVRDIVNPGSAESHGIRVEYGNGVTVEHCKLLNIDDGGIRISYAAGNLFSTRCRVLYCDVEHVHGGSGIEVMQADDCLVHGNTVKDTDEHGIRLVGATNPIITNNRLTNNRIANIAVQGFSNSDYSIVRDITGFVIEGNSCGGTGSNGIQCYLNARHGTIAGNVIRDKLRGIAFRDTPATGGGYDVNVFDNHIDNCLVGFRVTGLNQRLAFKNNTVAGYSLDSESSPAPNTSVAVYIHGGGKDLRQIFIEHNQFYNNHAGLIQAAVSVQSFTGTVYARYNNAVLSSPRSDGAFFVAGSAPAQLVTQLGAEETNTVAAY